MSPVKGRWTVLALVLLWCASLGATAERMETRCARQRDPWFVGSVDPQVVPSLARVGGYLLRVRAMTGTSTVARLEWRVGKGASVLSARTEMVYVPSDGELVRSVAVGVSRPGNYDIVAALTPVGGTGSTKPEPELFVRYLRVQASSSQDSATPFPIDASGGRTLDAQVKRAPAAVVAPGDARFTGRVTYHDDVEGIALPIREVTVQLAERVARGAFLIEQVIETVFTDVDGRFAFVDVPAKGADGTARTYRINVLVRNAHLTMTDHRGTLYRRSTDWAPAAGGTTTDLAVHWGLDDERHAIGRIFGAMLDERDYLRRTVGFERKSVTVEYPSLDGGTYYSVDARIGIVSFEVIRIGFNDGILREAALHEYGHAVMTSAYGDRFDAIPFGNGVDGGHTLHTVSDSEFAVSEGWAEFMEALVDDRALNVRSYRNANLPNIETNDWWTGTIDGKGRNSDGSIVEGAVASVLWDLSDGSQSVDTTRDVDDDGIANQFPRVWELFVAYRPKTVKKFRDGWIERGYPQRAEMLSIFDDHGMPSVSFTGDVNRDGAVDILDLVLVAQRFGESGPFIGLNPDLSGDGVVDIADLVIVAKHFGEKSVPAAPPTATGTVRLRALREPDGAFLISPPAAMRLWAARFRFPTGTVYELVPPTANVLTLPDATGVSLVSVAGTPLPASEYALRVRATGASSILGGELVGSDLSVHPISAPGWADDSRSKALELLSAYPSPANPEVWIPFRLGQTATLDARIVDVAGTLVRRWSLGELSAGDYTTRATALHWDGRNERGEPVASGVYWVVLEGSGMRQTRRLLIDR